VTEEFKPFYVVAVSGAFLECPRVNARKTVNAWSVYLVKSKDKKDFEVIKNRLSQYQAECLKNELSGLEPPKPPQKTQPPTNAVAEILALHKKGLTANEIAKESERTTAYIYGVLRLRNLKPNKRR
jgi:hypothetical protein